MEVLPFSTIKEKLGGSLQGDYLFRYLGDLNGKTVVVEDNYIDKDYLTHIPNSGIFVQIHYTDMSF